MEDIFDLNQMYCGIIRRGDVFLYKDKTGGRELLLVLQDDFLNETLPTVVCAKVERLKKDEELFVNEFFLGKEEFSLPYDYIARLYKVGSYDRRGMVAKKVEMTNEQRKRMYKAFDIVCGRYRDENNGF